MSFIHFYKRQNYMATIKKLKSGNWNCQIRIKGTSSLSKTFSHKSEAEMFARETENRIKIELSNETYNGLRYVLNTYIERVLINHDGSLRGSYELTTYLGNTLVRYFGDVPLGVITSPQVASFRESRLKIDKVSESTAKKEMDLLQRLYKFADVELGLSLPNPVIKVKKPYGGKIRTVVINHAQLESILSKTPAKYHDYFRLLMETSCRRSELLFMNTSWVNLEKRTISLPADRTKSKVAREVPLSKLAIIILKPLLGTCVKEIFKWRSRSVTQCFSRAVKRVGYKDVVVHTLRHSCLSRYGRMGLSVFQLRAISGHNSVRMLERYVKIDSQSVLSAMDGEGI
jgi:integrase